MGAASSNRGSAVIRKHADEDIAPAVARADRDAYRAENERLRERVALLERDLARARRCLASTRYSHEQRMAEARDAATTNAMAIKILCRLAFGRGGAL